MVTEKAIGEDTNTDVDQQGIDEGNKWDRDTENQLFGDGSEETPGEGPEDQPLDISTLTLEQIQAHPEFQNLQGRFGRQGNVLKSLTGQVKELQELVKTFRTAEAQAIISKLGDTPEARDLLGRLANMDEREANIALREQTLAPLEKQQTCSEIMADYGIPETSPDGKIDYRAQLMGAEDVDEMEMMGKALQKILPALPLDQPKEKKGGDLKQRQPALTQPPDKAQGSVAPQSFEQIEQAYIDGKISWQQYQQAAQKSGVKLQ